MTMTRDRWSILRPMVLEESRRAAAAAELARDALTITLAAFAATIRTVEDPTRPLPQFGREWLDLCEQGRYSEASVRDTDDLELRRNGSFAAFCLAQVLGILLRPEGNNALWGVANTVDVLADPKWGGGSDVVNTFVRQLDSAFGSL